MYFLAFLLTLRARQPQRFHLSLEGADASLSLLQAIRDKDACLREAYLRAALLWSRREHACMRLTCFGKPGGPLGSTVLQALVPGSLLQCPGHEYEVESVDMTDTAWTGVSTWSDMLGKPPGARMRFTFATPLITSNPRHGQTGNALPFPDPQTLFASVLRHWRTLDGPFLPHSGEQITQIARCVVSEYRLETACCVLAGRLHLGFLGWIEYTCRASGASAVTSLNALARLAFFTGSGYLTEHGMGVTTVTIAN
jgi:hypothetical protein